MGATSHHARRPTAHADRRHPNDEPDRPGRRPYGPHPAPRPGDEDARAERTDLTGSTAMRGPTAYRGQGPPYDLSDAPPEFRDHQHPRQLASHCCGRRRRRDPSSRAGRGGPDGPRTPAPTRGRSGSRRRPHASGGGTEDPQPTLSSLRGRVTSETGPPDSCDRVTFIGARGHATAAPSLPDRDAPHISALPARGTAGDLGSACAAGP